MEDHEWEAKTDREKFDWLRNAVDRKLTTEMNEIMAIRGHLLNVERELERVALSLENESRQHREKHGALGAWPTT